MRELCRDRDAELRETRHVRGVEALRVLDALPQAGGAPHVLGPLERVERGAVRGVADRVHADGPARRGALAHDLLELLAGRDDDTRAVSIHAVCEPSVPSMNVLR